MYIGEQTSSISDRTDTAASSGDAENQKTKNFAYRKNSDTLPGATQTRKPRPRSTSAPINQRLKTLGVNSAASTVRTCARATGTAANPGRCVWGKRAISSCGLNVYRTISAMCDGRAAGGRLDKTQRGFDLTKSLIFGSEAVLPQAVQRKNSSGGQHCVWRLTLVEIVDVEHADRQVAQACAASRGRTGGGKTEEGGEGAREGERF